MFETLKVFFDGIKCFNVASKTEEFSKTCVHFCLQFRPCLGSHTIKVHRWRELFLIEAAQRVYAMHVLCHDLRYGMSFRKKSYRLFFKKAGDMNSITLSVT